MKRKSCSQDVLVKRKRANSKSFISENILGQYKKNKKRKLKSGVDRLFFEIMKNQIANVIKLFNYAGDDYFYIPIKNLSDYFDDPCEVRYFLKNIDKFGFDFLGYDNEKVNLFFEKKIDHYLQKIIINSINTKKNNYIFNFNYFENIFSFSCVLDMINSCKYLELIKYDEDLDVILFTLVI